jgi:hypothetical protein
MHTIRPEAANGIRLVSVCPAARMGLRGKLDHDLNGSPPLLAVISSRR